MDDITKLRAALATAQAELAECRRVQKAMTEELEGWRKRTYHGF